MATILLDTDIVIEKLRAAPPVVFILQRALEEGYSFCITPITWAEIYAGIREGEEQAIQTFFEGVQTLSITHKIGQKAGEYLHAYHKSHGVHIADALIAATAFTEHVPLLTQNKKHFPMKDIRFYQR